MFSLCVKYFRVLLLGFLISKLEDYVHKTEDLLVLVLILLRWTQYKKSNLCVYVFRFPTLPSGKKKTAIIGHPDIC